MFVRVKNVRLLFWFFFQGSYGVVKLAYNEDDNTYYVRQPHEHHIQRLLIGSCSSHSKQRELFCRSDHKSHHRQHSQSRGGAAGGLLL